jgi:hypothetical protein
MAGFEWLGFFGGSLFGKTTYALIQAFAQAEKVALSLVLLGLLPPNAFGGSRPVGYHALSLPGVLRARVLPGNPASAFHALVFTFPIEANKASESSYIFHK